MFTADKIRISTGLVDLDQLLNGLRYGDNVVWRVDDIKEYQFYVKHLATYHKKNDLDTYYFRFSDHPPLLKSEMKVKVIELDPLLGFEHFIIAIIKTISGMKEGCFIFDSMSYLPHNCFSDRMIGNFFKLLSPHLHRLHSFAYFSYIRSTHSFHTEQYISDNTQILIDVYYSQNRIFLKPFQVKDRYGSEMFRLHKQVEDSLEIVRESSQITEVLSSSTWQGLRSASYRMIGLWDRMLLNAEEILSNEERLGEHASRSREMFCRLLQFIISRDSKVLEIAEEFLTLKDLIYIWKRMIGTGFIGGKAVGMLLAHAVLRKNNTLLFNKLEKHDSFYIGSDVFYTFLIDNGLWEAKQKQKDPEKYSRNINSAQKKMMKGSFPSHLLQRFSDMLDYFGQSPIIVRSSSLLEDAFGSAFAGKYESVFCPNQGTREKRLENLLSAIKKVYASAMSEEALTYRKYRGVLDHDEQMALLIQRVSGIPRGPYYYPQLSGVGFSFNPYAWSKEIDCKSGMLRLVYGLGTRAVDRSDNDYTRIIALNAPSLRPESNTSEIIKYSQKNVDAIDLQHNTLKSLDFKSVSPLETHIEMLCSFDWRSDRYYRTRGITGKNNWFISFEQLIKNTDFIAQMSEILSSIKQTYGSNVDIEFTCNFINQTEYKICLVQCRPFQMDEHDIMDVHIPEIPENTLLMKAYGAVVGRSSLKEIQRIIYVEPDEYGILTDDKRYNVARIISSLLKHEHNLRTLLFGPGRWGTTTPSLGVPVTFSEIRSAYAICEIDSMHEGLIPDLSLGTHFFNEMTETGMVYIGYFNQNKKNRLNAQLLRDRPNRIGELLPDKKEWENIIHVVDFPGEGEPLFFAADPVDQCGVLYFGEANQML